MLELALCTKTLDPVHVDHSHDFHQLILTTGGATELAIEGQGDRVTAARGCLIPSAHRHDYRGDGRHRTLVLDVPLASVSLLRAGDELSRLFERPRFFGVPPRLQRLAASLSEQLEQCPALHSEVAALLLRAIHLHLADTALAPDAGFPLARRRGDRLDLERIDAWVDRHLAEEIRVEQLATLCAMSVGHFHGRFRERLGMTPQAYVQDRRLRHARTLVGHSELSLGHVASLVGFRDQGSFSRAYRRRFAISPSADRARARDGGA
nr:AraC family transcriptional regulator [Halomonas sp.]